MGCPALKCHPESTLSSQGVAFSLLGLLIQTAWGRNPHGQLQCWLFWEIQLGGDTPEPRGKRKKITSGGKAPKERFGPPNSMGKGHTWLLATSEIAPFSTLLTHWPRKRRSAQDFQFPQDFCSSKAIRDAPEERPRVLTWCFQVSARAGSPHLKSPMHDSTANRVSVVHSRATMGFFLIFSFGEGYGQGQTALFELC